MFGRFLLTRWGIILREIVTPGYHTPGRLTSRGIIPQAVEIFLITLQILNQNRKYHGPGFDYEKKGG